MGTLDHQTGHDDLDTDAKHTNPLPVKKNDPQSTISGNTSVSNPIDSLIKFQTIVGINTPEGILDPRDAPKTAKSSSKFNRPSENIGTYQRVIELQKNRRTAYLIITSIMNICFLLQIVFAAILTALGASEAPHNITTVFGAINVAIAGLLAFYKGQGPPDRLRQDWVGLSKVRDYIEERERLLHAAVMLDLDLEKGGASGSKPEDLMAELKMVLAMYNQQIDTMEANRPDTYVVPPALAPTSPPKGVTEGHSGS